MRRLARLVGIRRRPALPPLEGPARVMVFDFDGTIGDTFRQGLEILNAMAPEFGYKPLLGEDVEKARGMTTRQLMRYLGIPNRRLPAVASRGIRELRGRINEVQPITGVPEVLRALHAKGVRLGIVTSNSEENVELFLKNHDLQIFDFVRSSSRLLGKSREIKAAMKAEGFGPDDVLFVGDETRDIEACRRARIRCAAVTWGYNSRASLVAQEPYCIFDAPEQLLAGTGIG
jgi:phosphoglycolate phosphatase